MEFDLVLKELLDGFQRLHIRCAAIGGFALGTWGVQRATKDLDFLVHGEDLEGLHRLMTALRYQRIFHSKDVSQYQGESVIWGYVDFLHAIRPLALRMLREALDKPVLSGASTVRVLRPEDIIGLKVQALANEPSRKGRDGWDIEALVEAHRASLDWNRVEEYYKLFSLEGEFKSLKERSNHA